MGFLTFKSLIILITFISIFIFLITITMRNNLNKNINLKKNMLFSIFSLKHLKHWRSNFVGNSFLNEALILIYILGLVWTLYLYAYNGLFASDLVDVSKWPIKCVFLYLVFQRILLAHFFLYLLCLVLFKSWALYRFVFLFYVGVDILFFALNCHYFDVFFVKAYVYFWYSNFTSTFFGVNMSSVNFFSTLYHFSFALFFVLLLFFFLLGSYHLFNQENILNSRAVFKFLKTTLNYGSVKNSFFFGLNYFLAQNLFFEIVIYFYVWAILFGRVGEFATVAFHGPYFLLKVIVIVVKILTLNYCLVLFMFWSFLFNAIFFWFKNFNSLNEVRLFLNYIYKYYSGSEVSVSSNVKIKNALYIFIAVFFPVIMVFDISLVSIFFYVYLLLVEDVQFWTLFCILFTFLYVIVLAITPNNDPENEQSNGRLFCVWVFNLSILISLFFLNSAVLYVFNSKGGDIGRKIYTGDTVFTSLSVAVDTTWINVIGEPLSAFLPSLSAGVFTFGYDYFAILLCVATSLIFSLIFLTSLFSASLNKKRYFFINLLIIEFCILLAFLNLNLLGFFVFFESSLVPMFLIIGLWGSSDRRWFAAKQMLFYSLTSSTPMIICIVHFYSVYGSLDYAFLSSAIPLMSSTEKYFFWFSLFLMFATKIPMFPFHSWLLNAHVEAPTGGSVILAAILLKLGIFGMIRYLFQLFNEISMEMAPVVISLALISVFYSSVCAVTELDSKRLIAHTSIAHMNISVLGLFIFDERGLLGAIYLSIGHVVTSAALFFLIGTLYDRFHTRNLLVFGGLVQIMPIFSTFLFFFVMANSGFPWTLSFIGEFFVLAGAARKLSLFVYLILIISSVCLMYANLRLFMFICFGTVNKNLIHNSVSDLTFLELYCITLLCLNGFVLMWNSSFFFAALFSDNIVRIIF